MRTSQSFNRLTILALLMATCWLSCRARFRLPNDFRPDGGWPMLGGNSAHTGQYQGCLRPPLKLMWRFRARGPIVSAPVVASGVVCVGSLDKRLYFLSALDGQPYGFLKTDSSISASPIISGEIVYFATELGDDALYAVDLITGHRLWKADILDVSTSLTLAHQALFIGSGSGSFHAFATEDGHELWRVQTEGQRSTPAAVADGVIYFGSDDGFLYAIQAKSGQEVWRRNLGGAIWSWPIVSGGRVLAASFDGEIYALRGEDGEMLWSFTMGGGSSGSPAIDDGTVYVGSDQGRLYALDVIDGSEIWSYNVGSPIRAAPLITSDEIVFGATDGKVYLLDSRVGELRWSYQTGRAIVASPAAWEDRIFIGSMDGYLYAFEQAGETYRSQAQSSPEEAISMVLDVSLAF